MSLKRIICLLLVLLMLTLCGCHKKQEQQINKNDNNSSSTPVMDDIQLEYKEKLPDTWQREIDYLNIVKKGKFTFAVQTDTHFEGSNDEVGLTMNYLSNTIDLNFFAHLGDVIRGYADAQIDSPENMRESMDEIVRRYTEEANCPVMMTVGNHDANSMWYNAFKDTRGIITEKEHYDRIIKPLKEHNGEKMVNNVESIYHYIDFPEHEIRAIMLNTVDSKFSYGETSTFNISQEQIKWFKDEALNTDYSVLVMMHTPLVEGFPKNNIVNNGEQILGAVENFISNGGDFIAYFCGHIHTQEMVTDSNGRVHLSFRMGGDNAEVVMIDKEKREINTVGLGDVKMRSKIAY